MSHPRKKNDMAEATERPQFRVWGDAINYFGIFLNILMTSLAMLGIPAKIYDEVWLRYGFCVNPHHPTIDTEVLCFIALATSSLILHRFVHQSRDTPINPQLRSKMERAVFSNLAHGFGHLFLYAIGGPPPPLELSLTLEAIGYLVTLFFFWIGTLQSVMISISMRQSMFMAVAVLGVQMVLNVPQELAFTYSQSVILIAGAVDQLLLPSKGFTYVAVALSYIPLFAFYVLEATKCTEFLAGLGGHLWYDLYLSVLPFALYRTVQHYESGQVKAKKTP